MGFNFRLEKVLNHRKSLEDQAKKEYLEADRILKEAEAQLEIYYESISDSQNERHILITLGGNQSEKLSQISDYIKGIEIKIERQKMVIRKQLAIVEERQRALQEAAIEYKIVDKLKERQHIAYRGKERKLEQKEQNEIANSRFKMRQKNEQ